MRKRKKTTVKIMGIIITVILLFCGFNFENIEKDLQNIENTIAQQTNINKEQCTIYMIM